MNATNTNLDDIHLLAAVISAAGRLTNMVYFVALYGFRWV